MFNCRASTFWERGPDQRTIAIIVSWPQLAGIGSVLDWNDAERAFLLAVRTTSAPVWSTAMCRHALRSVYEHMLPNAPVEQRCNWSISDLKVCYAPRKRLGSR